MDLSMDLSLPPRNSMKSPPEKIYDSWEILIDEVHKYATHQGFGIVKLRSSNYRDSKATRFDLVCDRGGVKYNSTAKKRNPTTRKIDCPWKAKAVCEVQLGNRWRFSVQKDEHNHEARVDDGQKGQENTPTAQSMRTITNKMDRMSHDIAKGFERIETHIESMEKRLEMVENRLAGVEAHLASLESQRPGMDVPMDNMEMGTSMLDGPVM
ncbi:hypothetical protein GGR54DRAFT_618838 [Hypoxylon sp. NC1633]|nr:hypothetical protein GGR54DRAFT_618838 [Hypoxylon sp. NC1633]